MTDTVCALYSAICGNRFSGIEPIKKQASSASKKRLRDESEEVLSEDLSTDFIPTNSKTESTF